MIRFKYFVKYHSLISQFVPFVRAFRRNICEPSSHEGKKDAKNWCAVKVLESKRNFWREKTEEAKRSNVCIYFEFMFEFFELNNYKMLVYAQIKFSPTNHLKDPMGLFIEGWVLQCIWKRALFDLSLNRYRKFSIWSWRFFMIMFRLSLFCIWQISIALSLFVGYISFSSFLQKLMLLTAITI